MKIEHVAISKLVLDPNNARKHDEKNLEAIKGSLTKFGMQKPIVVDHKGVVLAGNGTLAAAKALGWDKIAIVRTDLEGFNAAAYALADNRTSELASWDEDVLGKSLHELRELDFDLGDIGFDTSYLDDLLKDAGKGYESSPEDDEVPEVEENIHGVKLGDVWQLGEHRLLCGDSTVRENVERLMNGEKADMVFTDPPYDIGAAGKYSDSYKMDVGKAKDFKHFDEGFNCKSFLENLPLCIHEKGNLFVFGGTYTIWNQILPWMFDAYHVANMWVWAKKFAMSNVRGVGFAKSYEIGCYAWNKGHIFNPKSGTENYDVQFFASNEGGRSYEHPTAKPLALCVHLITMLSNDLVADLFLGSGSTIIACEKTGRRCYGMELDPHYCSVIIQRWQNLTGKKAIRLESVSK